MSWSQLSSRPSARNGRPIAWPVPAVLKKDAVQEASLQKRLGYKADGHFDRVLLMLPFRWNENPFRDKAWAMRLMCLQPMDAYLLAYDATSVATYLEDATAILLDWCRYHISEGRRSYLAWADMAVGYRALKIARIVDHLLSNDLTLDRSDIDSLMAAADRHLEELLDPRNISTGNHGIFQMHALRVLGEVVWTSRYSTQARSFSALKLKELSRRQFNDEGMHLEHSPKYHFWMARELRAIFQSGWHDVDYLSKLECAIEEAKCWLVDPAGELVQVGDTPPGVRVKSTSVPRPDFQTEAYMIRCFLEAGYAICCSRDAQLFLSAAYHSKAHKHADDLHFDLFDRGRRILVDSGAIGYKADARREYVLSTRAHNTVEVDGRSYPRDGTDAYGSAIVSVSAYERGVEFHARVDHASLSVTHERRLLYVPGHHLEIHDWLDATAEHEYRQWLHFAPSFSVEVLDGHRLTAFDTDIEISLDSNCEILETVRGGTDPLQGWTAREIDVLEPSWAVCFGTRAKTAYIRTAVRLSSGGGELGRLLWSRSRRSVPETIARDSIESSNMAPRREVQSRRWV